MVLPKRRFETGDDDIQTIDQNIESLKSKFLTPVDNIRSYSRPGPVFSGKVNEAFNGLETSTRPLESRAHAFMRFIGFPVAIEGDFYNPGFDPSGTQFLGDLKGVAKKKQDINDKFNKAPFKNVVKNREDDAEINREIFARQDLNSSLYSILLSTNIRPFQTISDKGPFEVDEQNFSVAFRQLTAGVFFNKNINLSSSDTSNLIEVAGINYTESRHILKPFVVDPRIDITVMPDTSRIAVPFLPDEQSLRIEQNKSVLRPGLELIIRERLRKSSTEDSAYLDTLKKIANNEIGPSDLESSSIDTRSLRSTAEAVLDDNEVNSSSILELQGITTVQVKYLTDLVKLLKGLVSVLKNSVEAISKIQNQINWVPIPDPEGPELGNVRKQAKLATEGTSNTLSVIDKRINSLRIQKFANDRQVTSNTQDIGNFASPWAQNTNVKDVESISSELSSLIKKRNKLSNIGFEAMSRIELIVGEASGLGLIDVISIYISLWAMDEKALISLLDNVSFDRLVNNFGDLIDGGAAADRRDNGTKDDITTALQNFEDKLRNVFAFVEKEFARQSLAPGEEEGGLISSDS